MNLILENRIKDKTHRKEIKQNICFHTISITEEVSLEKVNGEILGKTLKTCHSFIYHEGRHIMLGKMYHLIAPPYMRS